VRRTFTAYGCCTVTDPIGELVERCVCIDKEHAMTWLDLPADHPFGLAHLPYGVFSTVS
jgi:hypothetical protein